MTVGLLFISELFARDLRFLTGLFFIYRLLLTAETAEKPDKKRIWVGVAGSSVLSVFFFVFPLSDLFEIGIEAVWITACGGWFWKADYRMSLFVSIFYEIAVSFWQFLFSAGLGILMRSEVYLENESGCGHIAVWGVHFLLAALMFSVWKHPDISWKEGFRLSSMIIIAGFIAVVTLSEQTVIEIPDDTLTMWTILSMVLLMAVLVFHMNRQYEVEKEVARLKSEQAELLERDYTALNQAYSVNAKLFHDFHNHIGVLRQMLVHQNYDDAVRYLDELKEPVREMTDTVWTGDETVDYLINSKAAEAAARQISMQAEVEFPRHTNIRSADLCAVIGNLLDNALEASGKVSDPKERFVALTIRRINQMLIIKVENSFADQPRQEDGQLKTTKKEQGLHGWGLKSAQAAAEKYDGMIQTAYEGRKFRVVATLSFHAVIIK